MVSSLKTLSNKPVQFVYAQGPQDSHSSSKLSKRNLPFLAKAVKMIRDLENFGTISENNAPIRQVKLNDIAYVTFYRGNHN